MAELLTPSSSVTFIEKTPEAVEKERAKVSAVGSAQLLAKEMDVSY